MAYMIYIYGLADGNQGRFPNHQEPNHQTFRHLFKEIPVASELLTTRTREISLERFPWKYFV